MTILYISQDGIADHIGQSQIAPYILGLAARGHDIHLISAEKDGMEPILARYRARFDAAGVRWTVVRYHKPLLGTLRDLVAMTRAARRIARVEHISLIHCRSHPTMPVGMAVKRWTGARLLFDFRDFWADTGIAKGRFVPIYRFFKRLERRFIAAADHVNCLTERAAAYLRRVYPEQQASWSVIPCCADFDLFRLATDAGATRAELAIAGDATVLLYLGSIGPDYLLDRMMALFAALRGLRPDAIFLFVVNNAAETVHAAAAAAGLPREAIRVTGAPRERVPALIGAANLSVVFIRADLSKIGCSPTKLGETLACGVPVVANAGVGDLDALLDPAVNGSLTVTDFAPATLRDGLERVLHSSLSGAEIRQSALAFSLESGINAYASVYEALRGGS
ncbi:glycosyltransferase [Sphingomonas abietis]|uniref:Glycosyltransferase n=1 Tax=Sphingomonas abietis TaxID=3012344 RepID=A0ABY7NGZ2_9SPHN|nr:glycosyltransferase [Sphingomonas abietis]WBO20817.1 glycosyltransferase [Sphingomonas abietis]